MRTPILQSARLRLRGHQKSDFANSAAMWADPEVTRFIGGQPSTAQQAWSRYLNYVGHWSVMGFGYWLVEELETGKFVGEVGFADFHRDIDPSIAGIPESGWVIAPYAQGKGYATEALNAILEWGDRHFEADRTVCIISPENAQSVRVAQKCGYQQVAQSVYQGKSILIFSRPKALGKE
jgi:RimJ/RimL family protein N-acetyltransferase